MNLNELFDFLKSSSFDNGSYAEAKNRKRQTNTAVTLLRQYLTARNMPTDFESFGIEQLDDVLSTFYLEMQ
jgi:hypothetical protein